jgi:hypothetical protein
VPLVRKPALDSVPVSMYKHIVVCNNECRSLLCEKACIQDYHIALGNDGKRYAHTQAEHPTAST